MDTLFYEDTIRARIEVIPPDILQREFPKEEGEGADIYRRRMNQWISKRFLGYSVYHVQGRFRMGDLTTSAHALQTEEASDRYLVDETTAVARYIFPCQNQSEAKAVQFFFWELFVNSIVEVVSGEDQIWMVESGIRNRVHIWSAERE